MAIGICRWDKTFVGNLCITAVYATVANSNASSNMVKLFGSNRHNEAEKYDLLTEPYLPSRCTLLRGSIRQLSEQTRQIQHWRPTFAQFTILFGEGTLDIQEPLSAALAQFQWCVVDWVLTWCFAFIKVERHRGQRSIIPQPILLDHWILRHQSYWTLNWTREPESLGIVNLNISHDGKHYMDVCQFGTYPSL